MSRFLVLLSCLAILAFGLGLSGCGAPSPEEPATQESSDEAASAEHDEHAGHTHDSTEVDEAFADLSEEDRAAAEKQGTCPVSDEALGSMGTPCKVTVKGREVFLCCQGCEDAIKEDPDKYLAKLNE